MKQPDSRARNSFVHSSNCTSQAHVVDSGGSHTGWKATGSGIKPTTMTTALPRHKFIKLKTGGGKKTTTNALLA